MCHCIAKLTTNNANIIQTAIILQTLIHVCRTYKMESFHTAYSTQYYSLGVAWRLWNACTFVSIISQNVTDGFQQNLSKKVNFYTEQSHISTYFKGWQFCVIINLPHVCKAKTIQDIWLILSLLFTAGRVMTECENCGDFRMTMSTRKRLKLSHFVGTTTLQWLSGYHCFCNGSYPWLQLQYKNRSGSSKIKTRVAHRKLQTLPFFAL